MLILFMTLGIELGKILRIKAETALLYLKRLYDDGMDISLQKSERYTVTLFFIGSRGILFIPI